MTDDRNGKYINSKTQKIYKQAPDIETQNTAGKAWHPGAVPILHTFLTVYHPNIFFTSSLLSVSFFGIYLRITCWEEANPINSAIMSELAPARTARIA